MWDNVPLFFISVDVATCETSDCIIESRVSDVTYSKGYVAISYQASIQLKDF